MRTVRYTLDAARDLKRHGNIAARIRKVLTEYADDPKAHANNVTQLVGSTAHRMRIGDFRVVFESSSTELIVTRIGPRGNVYD